MPPPPPRPPSGPPSGPQSGPPPGPPFGYGRPVPGMPPPPPPASLHRTGRGLTIALVLVAVVAVGALGALAAVLLGGDEDDLGAGPTISDPADPEAGSGILDPEPVGSASPLPDPTDLPTAEPTEEPTEEPSAPEPGPGGPQVDPDGETVTIGPDVAVQVPEGWEVSGRGANDVALGNGEGSWGYVLAGVDDPATEASALISANLTDLLPTDSYSQLRTGDVRPLEPFGSLVSAAVVDYDALWVDAQSAIPLRGQVYAAVRQDGVVVLMTVEHTPPDDFDAAVPDWGRFVDSTLGLLGAA